MQQLKMTQVWSGKVLAQSLPHTPDTIMNWIQWKEIEEKENDKQKLLANAWRTEEDESSCENKRKKGDRRRLSSLHKDQVTRF